MPHRLRHIFLIADGARARFVERSSAGDFVTIKEMDGRERLAEVRAEQRSEPAGRSFESASRSRHGVGREDAYGRAKEAFAAHVADELAARLAKADYQGVVLVAPARLLPVLRAHIGPAGRIVGELAKDLTKTPDHSLSAWLGSLAFG